MAAYNRFGADYADVVALYPGAAVADFAGENATDAEGQTVVEEALDQAVALIVQSLTPEVFTAITEPELEIVVRRATDGQTTCTLGIVPIVAGSVSVWTGQPGRFYEKPRRQTDVRPAYADGNGPDLRGLSGPAYELGSTDFSVVSSTGVITLTAGLQVNDQVLATYRVDTTHASFAVPSLARLACRGAAAELGDRLYTQSTQEWRLVESWREGFTQALEALAAGRWVPDEIRLLKYWSEIERRDAAAGSVRLDRG